ncbi:methylated-DNA-[protein]-cysteine S-methyltransferase [Paenibacillus sp. UNCCL117]|uniref:methylated-DNA--[protein]-cysteine S-methyltransferase n=1 Tax=unclassified Paenibacillus TaxID=185978 RepID=UPI0008839A09|nr:MULTISPECIES: methylated-DNA--[protein]-cysteine S-methyltransferase [unclassified Paenibacillus]SDE63456.1 methylated-DNA-[protein]-cysteine S-methyltransferase [Paenibacillus sp. cl123]SFW70112.1 methylated-DNA-[protein]-cysteine S-methyltransferase [Paenibacillus sp. UNCCL117]
MTTNSIFYDEMDSPIGPLVLAVYDGAVCQVEFGRFDAGRERLQKWSDRWFGTRSWVRAPEAVSEARAELEDYFRGERTLFAVPLDLRGTPFQVKVWEALRTIPYSQVCSYKDIASLVGSPKAVRAVGGANNRNPVPIIVPCHRVIGAAGAMVGYGGGLEIKTYLLRHEGYPSGGTS